MKAYTGRGMEKRTWSLRAHSEYAHLPAPPYVHQPGSSSKPILLVFMEAHEVGIID